MLPDLAHPSYVREQSLGIGSLEFSFQTTNGVITSFNSKGDSKAVEPLGALTSGFGNVASGIKALAEAAEIGKGSDAQGQTGESTVALESTQGRDSSGNLLPPTVKVSFERRELTAVAARLKANAVDALLSVPPGSVARARARAEFVGSSLTALGNFKLELKDNRFIVPAELELLLSLAPPGPG